MSGFIGLLSIVFIFCLFCMPSTKDFYKQIIDFCSSEKIDETNREKIINLSLVFIAVSIIKSLLLLIIILYSFVSGKLFLFTFFMSCWLIILIAINKHYNKKNEAVIEKLTPITSKIHSSRFFKKEEVDFINGKELRGYINEQVTIQFFRFFFELTYATLFLIAYLGTMFNVTIITTFLL